MSEVIRDGDKTFAFAVPVVVIGAGAAGLIAALAAREAGADVLVLERDALPRGSTALSAGLIPAAGTRWQKDAGITDSPEVFAADVMAKAKNEPDPSLVALVTREAGPTIEWLGTTYGLPFSVIADFSYPGHSARRMHGLPTRSGEELIDALRGAAENAGIDILCEAHVTTLFADADNRVTGLAFVRPDGSRDEVGCDQLILACNGYGGNKDLVKAHIPSLAEALYFGHEGNKGDALLWGEALGAATRHLSGHQGHGSVAYPAGILISWATISEGGVQVNLAGERFCDESRGYSEQAAEVLAQPQGLAWTVFDHRIAAITRQFEDYKRAEAMGAIVTADDWPTLAARMGVPAEALAATMTATAEAKAASTRAAGARDAFGRDFTGVPQLSAPYCAVKVTGALFHTQGGLVVDDAARVLDTAGRPLPNLFAAGGAACGVSGAKAAGYLSGNGLLTAVTLGRVAGQAAGEKIAGGGAG
ncbi:FAD-dependent oxidoreductase [Chelatococcus asaccharovorans]|uniref:FAD-dependent oxidoreductase n=1 Tax=Chelatococcus asaccharovorans TaxID=28210 RepID=UPI00224C638F|nr:FAD-dependent oxidoreductase [Chelatococcus asaccharovorans]CAH1662870.1 Fumarate reductase flavoprotein subunit [Chelatococcus asaccharovorans]CAH1683035.1 Fumarate reductase flavoprotein subunit [Chelatococcus asaccharovorans]